MNQHIKHQTASRILKRVNTITSNGGLPKTGQWNSYGYGDDGMYRMGYPLGGAQRFVDNGDGTVMDLATGLMWVKDPYQIGSPFNNPMYWYDALNACENLEFAGWNDWRMPNINELLSIADSSRYNPCIDTMYFTPCPDMWGSYWSSTKLEAWSEGIWCKYLYDGYKGSNSMYYGMYWVRPVRSGQA